MPPQTPVKPSQHALMLWLQALLKESLIEGATNNGVPERAAPTWDSAIPVCTPVADLPPWILGWHPL